MLSQKARRAISLANKEDGIVFCEILLWEIAMLIKKGRIFVEMGYPEFIKLVIKSDNYIFRGITPQVAEVSTHLLSDLNRDPADSIIAATSIIENAKLTTAGKNLRESKRISTIW